MKLLRRVMFWMLAVAYAVICPLLIVHTLGYLSSGLIVVKARPGDAHILLNGLRIEHDMPATISHLPPGSYAVRVERPGYQPWSRDVRVKQGQATVLDHVFLLPNPDTIETITEEAFDSLHPIDGTPYIILLTKDRASDARVFNHERGELSFLCPTNAPYAAGSVRRVFTVPDSPYALAQIETNQQDLYLWIRLDTEPASIEDISSLIPHAPSHVRWSPDAPGQLFCFRKGNVNKVDVTRGTNQLDFATDWLGLGVFDDTIHGLNVNGRFVKMTIDGEIVNTEETEWDLDPGLFGKIGFVHIVPTADDGLLFHESGGHLLQTALPHLLVEDDVEGVRIYHAADRALVWRRRTLGILEKSDGEEDNRVFLAGKHVRWIHEGKQNISSVYFMYDGAYALCLLDATVTVFDLRQRSTPADEPRKAFSVREDTAIHYVDKEGMLYALDAKESHLVAVRLLPRRSPLERLLPGHASEKGDSE